VPLIFSFGAALEDLPLEKFLGDPTKISNTLRLIQNYFQVDGVVCYGDCTIVAEALGCHVSMDTYPPEVEPLPEWPGDLEDRLAQLAESGRVVTALEVTRRLNILLPESILVGLAPGPLTVAHQLTGLPIPEVFDRAEFVSFATKASLTFAKALGDAGIDSLIVTEKVLPPLGDETAKVLAKSYAPIWNTAKFYDLSPLLMVEQFAPGNADRLRRVVDGLVFPAEVPPESRGKVRRLSLSVPVGLLEQSPEEIESFLQERGFSGASKVFLVTTEREVPQNINKELMIRGIHTVRDCLQRES
jgi:hypothetical protein